MYPTTGTKLNPEARVEVERLAKSQGKTVSMIVREAVMAYIGQPEPNATEGLPAMPEATIKLLIAAKDIEHPLHSLYYALYHAPQLLHTL